MKPLCRSIAVATMCALLMALAACGGSPPGLHDAPAGTATEGAALESGATRLGAPPQATPSDQVAVVTPSAEHRPQAPQPTGCAPEADQPVAADGGRAVEEAPDSGDDVTELVPAERPQEVAREAG